MDDKQTQEIYRQRLAQAINKVPERIASGSVQATRNWIKQRESAEKLLKKPNATVQQLMSALQSIQ